MEWAHNALRITGRVLLIAVGCLVVLAGIYIGLIFWGASSESTECFASFKTPEAADRAASMASDLGYDSAADERDRRTYVRFESGETGDDAKDFRSDFLRIMDAEDGTLAHGPTIRAKVARARGETGCIEAAAIGR